MPLLQVYFILFFEVGKWRGEEKSSGSMEERVSKRGDMNLASVFGETGF